MITGFRLTLLTMVLICPALTSAEPANRPQTPEAGDYEQSAVQLTSRADGTALSGTLTLPHGCQPCAATILLGVAGPNDRDLEFAGHQAFAVIADTFAQAGIGSLRWDDRGVGASTGHWSEASYSTLAADAASAIEFLRSHPAIDPESIGAFGLSEGALIAAMVASNPGSAIDWVILASPPGLMGEAALRLQLSHSLALSGTTGDATTPYFSMFDEFVRLTKSAATDVSQMPTLETFLAGPGRALVPPYHFVPRDPAEQASLFSGPWYQSQLNVNPATYYQKIASPTLVISGDKDLILPPEEHLPTIRQMLPNAHYQMFSNVSHLLQPSLSGSPLEYAQTELTVEPQILRTLTDWVAAHGRIARTIGDE